MFRHLKPRTLCPGLSLSLCVSAGTEPDSKCGVGRLSSAPYPHPSVQKAEDCLAHVAEAEADVAADPAVDRQHRAGGDQCEIALALADLLERPTVPLDRNRDADLHQQLARLERGFKVALEERLARDRPLARGAARDQSCAKEIDHQRHLRGRIVVAQIAADGAAVAYRMMRDQAICLDH